MITFNELNLSDDLMRSIDKLGYENPTLIQEKSIPSILEGKDLMGESATGSGKTLAFGCGVIERVIPKKGLQALILTPTRELAEQVRTEIDNLANNKKLKIISIYGGVSINPQFAALKKADVVIATPGRFLDHLERRTVDTSKINLIVLDEADRMLDMGFIDDIEKILSVCPKQRQTLFFSATFANRIEELVRKHSVDPVKVLAKKQVDPEKMKQFYYDIPKNLKMSLLIHLLKNESSDLVMVFCNTRKSTDLVVKNLRANKIDAIAIHGGFTQNKRSQAMDTFKIGKAGVLVCTDVAARGIHVEHISHIYNYEVPADPTDYVHRIGRTARAGEIGQAINLICEYDHENFSRIFREFDFEITKIERPYIERVELILPPRRPQRKGFRGRRR
ncbi:DEAD/DEAH box helicase [Candidatus Woesearchaeota archaeon]|nr:DEAD/DEAH box helicase [Candidatus Woesearchaeota archaeon]